MSTLIVYASTHGFTEMCVHRIARQLPGTVQLADLTTHPHPDLDQAGVVVVGGSIHLGSIQPVIATFCEHRRDSLLRHPLGLFICCLKHNEEAHDQFDNAYALRLRAHAFATAMLGGALYFDRMSLLQRWIVRKTTGLNESIVELDAEALQDFTEAIIAQVRHLSAADSLASSPSRN